MHPKSFVSNFWGAVQIMQQCFSTTFTLTRIGPINTMAVAVNSKA